MFRELCGENTLENVVLVTNMWDDVSRDAGESRERELSTEFFKSALDKGAQMARHSNTEQSAHDILRKILRNRPVVLQIQRELVDERKDITHTSAGETINKELSELIKRHQASLDELREEMEQALKKKDEETRQELEEDKRRLQEEMTKIREGSEAMASNYTEEKQKTEARMKKMEQEAKRERERLQAEYDRQIDELQRRLQDMADAPIAELEALEQKIQKLERQRDEAMEGGCCVVM